MVQHYITVYSAPQARNTVSNWRPGSYPTARDIPGDALVESVRTIELKQGLNQVDLGGIGEAVDPTSLRFVSDTDPEGTRILEQQVLFPTTDQSSLLRMYKGKTLQIEQDGEHGIQVYRGQLLNGQGGPLLRLGDGSLLWTRDPQRIVFSSPPDDLTTETTARLHVEAAKAGAHQTRIRYETGGLTWWADYDIELDDDNDCHLSLSPWVTLLNRSGANYQSAELRLIAGEPRRNPPPRALPMARMVTMDAAGAGAGFSEQAVGEYHLYRLESLIDLEDESLRQIALFQPVPRVACKQRLVYESSPGYRAPSNRPVEEVGFGIGPAQPVRVFLAFENTEDAGLGRPLPAGKVRVSSRLADQTLVLLGEDELPHTAVSAQAELELGNAFDIRGERKQLDFNLDTTRRTIEEEFELSFTNGKSRPVKLEVRETLYRWYKAQILSSTIAARKTAADEVSFDLTLPAQTKTHLRYRVRYQW